MNINKNWGQMQPQILLMVPSKGERRPSAVAGTEPKKGLEGHGDSGEERIT